MKLLVNIDQKGSLRAGYDAPHSTETVEISITDIPQELREWFADNYNLKTGEVRCEARRNEFSWGAKWGDWSGTLTLTQPITIPAIISALRSLHAEHTHHRSEVERIKTEDRNRELEAIRSITSAGPETKYYSHSYGESTVQKPYKSFTFPSPDFQVSKELITTACRDLHPSYEEARSEAMKEVVEVENRREAAEKAAIASVIPTEHIDRFNAGLMSRSEICKHIRASILPPKYSTGGTFQDGTPILIDREDYTPLTDSDLEHSEDCCGEGCESEYETDQAPSATPSQWEVLQDIRKTYPNAKLMQHTGRFPCNGDEWVFRHSVRVTSLLGVHRDFAAPSE